MQRVASTPRVDPGFKHLRETDYNDNVTFFWDEGGKGGTVTPLDPANSFDQAGEAGIDAGSSNHFLTSTGCYTR